MKQIFLSLLLFSLLFAGLAAHPQEKVTGLLFTTSSNEAKSSFSEGLKYSDLGENRKAREAFQKAIEQDPKLAIAYVYRATYATTPQEFASNLKKAKENLSTASDWEKLFYEYTASFLTDDANARLAAARKMVSLFPQMARSYVYLGESFQERKDYLQARQNFQKAISLEPTWPMSYMVLTNSYLFDEPRDLAKAEETATKLVTLQPNISAYILLGDAYRAENNMQKARDNYAKAIETDPQAPDGFYKRGHANTYLGDYDKARTDYEQAGKLDVSPANAQQMIAFTYLYQNEPAKALDMLMDAADQTNMTDATQGTSSKYELLSTAALVAFHMNDAQKLQSIIDAMAPLSEEIGNSIGTDEARRTQKSTMLYWKGIANAMENDFMNALTKADEMKTTLEPIQNPRKLEGYEALMGYISYQQKNYKKAAEHFAQTNMQDMYNKYWLAKAYEATGKKDKATALYKEIAHYNFNNAGYALVRNEVLKKI